MLVAVADRERDAGTDGARHDRRCRAERNVVRVAWHAPRDRRNTDDVDGARGRLDRGRRARGP